MRNKYNRKHRERDLSKINALITSEGITDDIEMSLWEIKEVFDIPTEEIEIAVASRRKSVNKIRQTLKNE